MKTRIAIKTLAGTVAFVLSWSLQGTAQNLFVADTGTGNIYEFTPGGMRSTFASGVGYPAALAFNNAGNLFVADNQSGNIYEFTPSGARSIFASGLGAGVDIGLAFNGAGDLFVADSAVSGNIYHKHPAISSTASTGYVNH